MSALDNLLDEVRLEAEQAVRTEYENTVIELRQSVRTMEESLAVSNSEWDKWRNAYNKLVKDYDALVERVQAAIR